jgi:uncharacterized surface protein with fasciclin (FAS1) repeats
MNNKTNQILGIILSIFLLMSCEDIFKDKHQEVYENPPWLGGTIHETLEKNGNFTNLLKLIERAGYDEAIEKGLFTIFAADDEAFQEYFEKEGISSIDDLSDYDALQLFTLNVMNTPRSRNQLIYDFLMGVWQEEGSEVGALIFRWPTRSKARIEVDTSKYFESSAISIGDPVHIYGQDKYVPLISTEFMRDYRGATDGSDYTYFFPETEWSGLQWYNANVDSAEIRCSNGYLYFLDKVVPEIPSIEEYLRANQDKYGLFFSIAQKYATYSYAGVEDGISLYNKSYNRITNFANEIGPYNHPIYTRRSTFTAFVPTNSVLQDYLDNTVFKYYESIDSVPDVTLIYLIQSHITSHFDLVSKMREVWYNYYGDEIPVDPDKDFNEAVLLSNGAFYEVNRILEPLAFTTVCGPLFYNSNYTTFLHILNSASSVLPSLGREDVYATVLAPSNEKLEEYGVRFNKVRDRLEIKDKNDLWIEMTREQITDLAKDHYVFENIEDFSGKGVMPMASGSHIYFDNNMIIAGGNQEENDQSEIIEIIDSEVNGRLMLIDNVVKAPKYDIINRIAMNPDFSNFLDICYDVGLIDTVEDTDTKEDILRLSFLSTALEWTAFIPDNDAIDNASGLGEMPSDSAELVNFIQYHFIKDVSIYDYLSETEAFETALYNDSAGIYSPLNITVSPENLSVTDLSGQTVNVPHNTANIFAKDGIIHRIGSILKYE